MPRPTNKAELLTAADAQWGKLWKLVDSLSAEEQNATFLLEDRDKNLRDVLAHLHEWHLMVESWHRVGTLEGGMPDVPGKGYTWQTLPALNQKIWERVQGISLEEIKGKLRESHEAILRLIEGHTNEELFDRGVYKWTRSTTLGAYFISGTASHYDWAMKKIRAHGKAYRAAR